MPDAYWKVIIRGSGKTIAWLIPNSTDATRAHLDQFLISPKRLQKLTGVKLPEVPKEWRRKRWLRKLVQEFTGPKWVPAG